MILDPVLEVLNLLLEEIVHMTFIIFIIESFHFLLDISADGSKGMVLDKVESLIDVFELRLAHILLPFLIELILELLLDLVKIKMIELK